MRKSIVFSETKTSESALLATSGDVLLAVLLVPEVLVLLLLLVAWVFWGSA